MNILIIYATNSGGTERVAHLIGDLLGEKGHTVTKRRAAEAQQDEINGYDAVMLGSCSWDYKGSEGQPHIDMRGFLERAKGIDLSKKKVAVFGLGDTSYMYFTGAVNHLEQFVADAHGSLLVPSLRIDGFYFDLEKNEELAKDWGQKLAAELG